MSLFIFQIGFSQKNNHPYVKLIEKQHGKRLELFAKNTDTISYSVFLRITTNDFRRSSNRPVLETINPKSEKLLITLIKLVEKEGVYDSQFIVNKYTEELSFTKDNDGFEKKFNEALNNKTVMLFATDACDFCNVAKNILKSNNIVYKTYNFSNNQHEIFKSLNIKDDSSMTKFILKIQDSVYHKINNKETLIKTLKTYFPELD
jgi:uncharacterized protein (DUF885 family)